MKSKVDVVSIGDAFVDIVTHVPSIPTSGESVWSTPIQLHGGGTAANVASGLAKLQIKSKFLGKFGKDQNGDYLLSNLKDEGVDISYAIIDPSVTTGSTFIMVEPSGERVIIVCATGASYSQLSIDDISFLIESPPTFIFITGVMLGIEPAQSTTYHIVEKFKGKSTIFFDPNLRHPGDSVPDNLLTAMQEISSMSDYVLSGDKEVETLDLSPNSDQVFIVKCGSKGALIDSPNGTVTQVDAHKVEVVDTVGAGDSFDAAFIASKGYGYSDADSLGIANAAAALAVTKSGARSMPAWSEALEMWKKKED